MLARPASHRRHAGYRHARASCRRCCPLPCSGSNSLVKTREFSRRLADCPGRDWRRPAFILRWWDLGLLSVVIGHSTFIFALTMWWPVAAFVPNLREASADLGADGCNISLDHLALIRSSV